MAAGNEILFGRIAVYNGLLSAEQLDRCLLFQREHAPSKHLGQVMLERGLLDEGQTRAILLTQRRVLHSAARHDRKEEEEALIENAVRRALAGPEEVARARKTQAEMEERGLFPFLGDILVQQGVVSLRRMASLLAEIAVRFVVCASCGGRFHAYKGETKCPDCGKAAAKPARVAGAHREPREGPSEAGPPAAGAHDEKKRRGPSRIGEKLSIEAPPPKRPAAWNPKVGDVLAGCRLEEKIGRGGMGEIYRARHLALDKEVAVKVIAPHLVAQPHHVQRFLAEARAAARVEHPNIVQVYDAGQERGTYFMVLQFVRGESLRDILRERGRLAPRETLDIVKQTALALSFAHGHGMVHRDVKPGNLMIDESGVVKLLDFGLTKDLYGDAHLTTAGVVVGTVQYMSPEHAEGHHVDGRSDLYSLGVTWFEMLTGGVPFDGASPWTILIKQQKEPAPDMRSLFPEIPGRIAGIVLKLLEKDPDTRFASAEELVEAVEEAERAV